MPDLEFFLVCESISIDRESNRISLFNVIESIKFFKPIKDDSEVDQSNPVIPAFPLTQLIASSCWNSDQEEIGSEFQATLRMQVPGRDAIDFKLNFTIEQRRHRLNFKLQGIPLIKEEGDLIFELLLDGKHIATHTIDVKLG